MNKPAVIVSFVLGAVFGGGYVYVQEQRAKDERYEPIEDSQEVSRLEDEVDALRRSEQEALAENEALAEQLAALERKPTQASAIEFKSLNASSVKDERLLEGMKRMEEMMGKQATVRLDTLVRRLGLDEDQAKAFEDLLMLQVKQRSDIKMSFAKEGGTIMMNKSKGPFIGPNDFEDLAKEILSEDQFAAYSEMRADEDRAKWETIATSRVNHMAPTLGLSEEERDLAYAVYYEESQTMGQPMSREEREEQVMLRDERLKEILGPDRFEAYQNLGGGGIMSKRVQFID